MSPFNSWRVVATFPFGQLVFHLRLRDILVRGMEIETGAN